MHIINSRGKKKFFLTSLFYGLVDTITISLHTQVLSSAFHPDFKSIILYVSMHLEPLH